MILIYIQQSAINVLVSTMVAHYGSLLLYPRQIPGKKYPLCRNLFATCELGYTLINEFTLRGFLR